MFKKSGVNPEQPNIKDAKPKGDKSPVARPNSPASTKGRVIQSEASPAKNASTFKAPRVESKGDTASCGYERMGMKK